jgi:ppGpp synthetase/RelA/SpoT-type nucleotidyltranferase
MRDILAGPAAGSGSSGSAFDFDSHRRQATQAYQRVRPLYETFAAAVQDILAEALRAADIKAASIESRAKTLESFANKAAQPSENYPELPKYTDPINQIEDLAAARVITFFLDTIEEVDRVIKLQFAVLEQEDKSHVLLQQERLGYQSVHYVVQLKPNRTGLPEYARYFGLRAEIQLRTVLQHAWAEIEHDIQYKSVETIPTEIRRRFMALAGLLEVADREFQAVQKEDDKLRIQARASVAAGRLDQVEITGDALKAYLDKKLGPDGRMAKWAYESTALVLKQLGFTNFRQVDECIAPYDHDSLSRAVHGTRQGQLTRFEDMVQAALGESFVNGYPSLIHLQWWMDYRAGRLAKIRATGVPVGTYKVQSSELFPEGNSTPQARSTLSTFIPEESDGVAAPS